MNEQLPLLGQEYICDGCEAHAFAPDKELPEGWVLFMSGLTCVREKGKRRCERVEVHFCAECRDGRGQKLLNEKALEHFRGAR